MDKKDFKQMDIEKNDTESVNLYREYEKNYPKYFMEDNNVPFNVLSEVFDYNILDNGVELHVTSKVFINRHFWTHETMMNCLYEEKKTEAKEAFVKVEFFKDSVFRIRINEGEALQSSLDLKELPTRMLVGEPEEDINVEVYETENSLSIKTDEVDVNIAFQPFVIQAYNKKDELIFSQKGYETWISDSFRTSYVKNDEATVFYESLLLRQDEKIFGLGERFDHISREGKDVDFWNKDAIGTTSRRSYINVPFYFSNKGYGLFLNSYGRTQWEVGTIDSGALTFAAEGKGLDYFVICEDTPAMILKRYAELTGFADMPPVWSFGLWMSRNSYMSWDVVDNVIEDMDSKGIPFDVIHLDTAWFNEDWNCDLRFSKERFNNPKEKIGELKKAGIYISLWQYNFIPNKVNQNLLEAKEKGYLVKAEDGTPYRYPDYVKGSWTDDYIIDFTNPEAAKWYAAMIEDLVELGAGAIKTDFGEGVPSGGVYSGIDGREIHNCYSLIYNHIIYNALKKKDTQTLVWARSGTAGSQRYPIHWGGDCQCTWSGLSGTLKGMLSAGLSGIAFFSHDIGGFIGTPTPELYIRWAQLGLLSSHSRCHGAGNNNSREPSAFGEEATKIFKKYADLRYALMPYIIKGAEKSVSCGLPFIRHLVLSFPNDEGVYAVDDEYMFGEDILAAPILQPIKYAKTRTVYLPFCEAGWYEYITKKPEDSGYHKVKSILSEMPLYVKGDAVIPYAKPRKRTNNEIGEIEKIEVYPRFSGKWVYEGSGIRIELYISDGCVKNLNHNMKNNPDIIIIK